MTESAMPKPPNPFVLALQHVTDLVEKSDVAHIHNIAKIDFEVDDVDFVDVHLLIKVNIEEMYPSAGISAPIYENK